MINITGYILCGGKSRRFGSDKALLKINNRTLIEIVAGEMKGVFNEVVLVTGKREKYTFLNLECIEDIYRNCGPLAGIHAALNHSKTDKIFVISCDMLLITMDVIKFIADYKSEREIIIPEYGGKKHFLCAAYKKSVLWRAKEILEQTKDMEKCASIFDLCNISGYDIIDFDKKTGFDPRCFFNLNTLEDLEKSK